MSEGPINCGSAFNRIGGELITAGQCFDALGRLMLMETDADNETLMRILETSQHIEAWLSRIAPTLPTITAAERNHQ